MDINKLHHFIPVHIITSIHISIVWHMIANQELENCPRKYKQDYKQACLHLSLLTQHSHMAREYFIQTTLAYLS